MQKLLHSARICDRLVPAQVLIQHSRQVFFIQCGLHIYVVAQKLVPAFINILLIQSKIRLVSLENTSKDPIGQIRAIPIVIYHRIDDSGTEYSTTPRLFDEEMKYLHDNGFDVLSIRDIGYDEQNNTLYIKGK